MVAEGGGGEKLFRNIAQQKLLHGAWTLTYFHRTLILVISLGIHTYLYFNKYVGEKKYKFLLVINIQQKLHYLRRSVRWVRFIYILWKRVFIWVDRAGHHAISKYHTDHICINYQPIQF